MAAQSGKLFKETLCESRAHPVDTSDPSAAKAIDDLKRLVARFKAEVEVEKTKLHELQWKHDREVRSIHEDAEKKLERSLDALSRRKDDEREVEMNQVKERLLKQNQGELRTQRVELEEEMKRLERRLTKEREESMRKVLNLERRKNEEELSRYLPEDSVVTREEHFKAEIFRLGEEVERLEFQVSNLQRENREQINLIKKTNHEHKLELENLRRMNQVEAARDMAQLKLAEQIIQEKERHIQEEEYRVDVALMEKEALVEELAGVKSKKTLEALGHEEVVQSPTSGKRMSLSGLGGAGGGGGGGGGVLQRRVDELETALRKLDEERRQLKQENASLRKAAVKEGGGGEGDTKATEEKLKRLRKRNAELVALARQLDDKTKSLKTENEQLKISGGVGSSVVSGGGGGEKGKGVGSGGGGGEVDVRRSLSRQHAKDISEYTKQILVKDRELESLRTRLSKYEENGKARYEPSPEMEKRVRALAMERLRLEKVMVQLYSKVSNPLDVGVVTNQEMANESQEMEKMLDENKSLREELELLKSQARMEDVDHSHVSNPSPLVKQYSVPTKVGGGGGGGGSRGGSERERHLSEENSKLQAKVLALSKYENEVVELETALKETESAKMLYEQQNRRLTQQLKQAQQLAQEMDVVQESCVELEKEVTELKSQLKERDSKISQLEKSYQDVSESLSYARQESDSLRTKVEELEVSLRGKQEEIVQLATELDKQPSPPPPPPPPPESCDAAQQTSFNSSPDKPAPSFDQSPTAAPLPPPEQPRTSSPQPSTSVMTPGSKGVKGVGERRVKSAGRMRRIRSPVKRGLAGVGDVSLDNEMRLAGVELTDSYDSSEGVGFSESNLDGSSILFSLEDEGGSTTRKEGVGGGGGGGREADPIVAWLDEGERQQLSVEEEEEEERDRGREERTTLGEELRLGARGEAEGGAIEEEEEEVKKKDEEKEENEEVTRRSEVLDGFATITTSTTSDADNHLNQVGHQDEPVVTGGRPADSAVGGGGGVVGGVVGGEEGDPSSSNVAIFIAKYSYVPAEMSPNPNYDQELAVSAGDYLFVYGDMDVDGFYTAQLETGRSGLVPSNFVEKVEDTDEAVIVRPPPVVHHSRVGRMSNLNDISEQEEDISLGTVSEISESKVPPPTGLELKTQYVEDDKYCVVIQWSGPESLTHHPSPSSTLSLSSSSTSSLPGRPQVTYHVYVNGEFKQAVGGVSGTMTTELNNIARHQLVKISVRTVTDEGESLDPKKIIIINPQYPEPPTKVQLSLLDEEDVENEDNRVKTLSSRAILVEWIPGRVLETGAIVSGYIVLINGSDVTHVVTTATSTSITKPSRDFLCAKLLPSHLSSLSPLREERLLLTVRSVSDQYQSLDSAPVLLPRELFDIVVVGSNWSEGRIGLESSGGRTGEEREGENSIRGGPVIREGCHVTTAGSHVTSNGLHVNGSMNGNGNGDADEIDGMRERIKGAPRYYLATFSYNPSFHSPNVENVDEELAFRDGDIITAVSEIDEEGFFEGLLRGKRGLVPSNMVELVTDQEKLAVIEQTISEQECRSPDPLTRLPAENGGESVPLTANRKMRALFKYDPLTDSPNDNKEEELCIDEGDILTVFGQPDEDGYYQGELKGKKGLVPSNFLEEYREEQEMREEEKVKKRRSAGMEIFAASEQDMEQAKRIIAEASDSLKQRSTSLTSSAGSPKHRKGIFAKGKELLSKSVGKK